MTRKHYIELASIVGNTLREVTIVGGEDAREAVYDKLYNPLCTMLKQDNPNFDRLRFSAAVATAENRP